MTPILDIDWDDAPPQATHRFALRGQQPQWLATIIADFETKSRLLVVAPGGVGKTTLFAALAAHFHGLGIRTLVLENRDRLTRQTADRIRSETGIEVDIEMGDEHASPFAPIVVASVQTLGRVNRLTGFSDTHFGLIVADECHFALSPGWQRILSYFHYGAHSLLPDWKRPEDGTYEVKARCAGFSVGPSSIVELRGGCFGSGFVGSIESAFVIARNVHGSHHSSGFETCAIKDAEGRGWGETGFVWKTCKKLLRHSGAGIPFRKIKFHGGTIELTDCHSIYVANHKQGKAYSVKNNHRFTHEAILSCPPSSDVAIDDVLVKDDGASWCSTNEPKMDLIDFCLKRGVTFGVIVNASGKYDAGRNGRLTLEKYDRQNKSHGDAISLIARSTEFPVSINLSDWAYILGFWIGDGWLNNDKSSKTRVTWAVERASVNHLEDILRNTKSAKWNVTTKPGRGDSFEVSVNSLIFSEILRSIFGNIKCHEKFIPPEWIVSWSKSARTELLRGLIDSDGSRAEQPRNRRRHFFITTSEILSDSLMSLLRSLGVSTSVHVSGPVKGGVIDGRLIQGKFNRRTVHWSAWHFAETKLSRSCGKRDRYLHNNLKFNEGIVRGCERIDAPEFVYDLEMEGHPSFVANGVLVHNTATPDIGERRNLGQFFHHRSVNYSYLEAVQDGWLVGPVQKNIPVRIDLSKYKAKSTPNGNDFAASDLSAALIPIIEELAEQILICAGNKKTIAFLPSVECARMMTDALLRRGMRAIFVSGECLDASEKTDAFAALGAGSVLVNCCLYVYGVDFPDVDCIAWFRATISKAFYIQGIYRGTRVLPGILNGLNTAEERRDAIAASAKPFLLILDPLFVSDRIDLLDAYDLLTDEPEVKKAMKAAGELSVESAQKAERDFLKSLKKEAKKHERKAPRTIDPLAWAVAINDEVIRSYVPKDAGEARPASVGQLALINRFGMKSDGIKSAGLASRVIGRLIKRSELKLAKPWQLLVMQAHGLDAATCTTVTEREADAIVARIKTGARATITAPTSSAPTP